MSPASLDSVLDEVLDRALAKYADLFTPEDLRLVRAVMREVLSSDPRARALLEVVHAARVRRAVS